MRRDWIQTSEGRALEVLDPKREQIGSIAEIARALSCKARFTGQTSTPYTVAEHCVRGSRLLPPAFAGAFLLHELSEVYLPDIASPLKPHLCLLVGLDMTLSWSELERRHTRVILESLGLSSLESVIHGPEVRAMDLAMLLAEKRDLLGPEPESWGFEGTEPAGVDVSDPWGSAKAAGEFLTRFRELFW